MTVKVASEGTLRILHVEDDPEDAARVRAALRERTPGFEPFEVVEANRLTAAVMRIVDGDIDAVLLDLNLPDAHGLSTFVRLRAVAPHLPIVVLTGLEDVRMALQAVQLGAHD